MGFNIFFCFQLKAVFSLSLFGLSGVSDSNRHKTTIVKFFQVEYIGMLNYSRTERAYSILPSPTLHRGLNSWFSKSIWLIE